MQKPANLIYGIDEKPPLFTNIALGFQHTILLLIGSIFPVMIIRSLGIPVSLRTASSFVSISMMTSGIITLLQALKKNGIGSGYLCPSISSPTYFSASVQAASLGGLPLIFGMSMLFGLLESLFSRAMRHLRSLFPPEVTGTVVALVGIVVIPVAVKNLVGIGYDDTRSELPELLTGLLTLTILVGFNVFSKGKLRLFSAIAGMMAGYLLAFVFGIFGEDAASRISQAPLISIPWIENMRWRFDAAMIIPFLIASFSSALKATGDIATCQRINDTQWKRIDMKNVSAGVLVDGLGNVIGGMLGSYGQSTSSSNIGFSLGTGATSRAIAWSTGTILILLSFLPKLANVFLIMPKPVMGALLIFSVTFMIITGLQMIMSRMLDARKIFVVGISLIFGLSVDMAPQVYEHIHPVIKPLFSSSLSLGAVTVVVMNLLMRIGIKRTVSIFIDHQDLTTEKIFQLTEKQGQLWGARPEIMNKIAFAMTEVTEEIFRHNSEETLIDTKVSFDEFRLEVIMEYPGEKLKFPSESNPSINELTPETSLDALSGFLISRYCDSIKVTGKNNLNQITMLFEH